MGIWSRFNPDILEHAEVTLIAHAGLNFPVQRYNVPLAGGDFVHCVKCGDSTKPTLVLIHGYMGGGMIFFSMLKELEMNFRIVLVDLPGMGRSSRPEFTAENEDEAENFFIEKLEEFFEVESMESFILAGHSFGGYISGVYAAHYPLRVIQLVLISAIGVKLKPEGYDWKETVRNMDSWKQRSFFRFASWVFRKNVSPADVLKKLGPFSGKLVNKYTKRRFPDVSEEVRRAMNDYLEQMALLPGSGEYALHKVLEMGAWARKPLALQLTSVQVPMVFYYGDDDWMSPSGAVEVKERTEMPVYIEIVDHSDHHIYMDNPHQLAESIAYHAQSPGQRNEDYDFFLHYHEKGR